MNYKDAAAIQPDAAQANIRWRIQKVHENKMKRCETFLFYKYNR